MAHKSAIESAGASGVVKAGVFRRLGRPIALVAAALGVLAMLEQRRRKRAEASAAA